MSTIYFDEDPVEFALLDGFRHFSFKHIALGDVDPIYTMIKNSQLSYEEKKRFTFSHLMVYDLKSSIALSDEKNDSIYYDKLLECFKSGKLGKDRKDVASRETNEKSRTFGTQLPKMRMKSPEEWIQIAIDETIKSKSWAASLNASKIIPTFGEYFAFKLADMIETIFDIKDYTVKFDSDFVKSLPRGSLTGYEMVRTGSTSKFRSAEEIRNCELLNKFYLTELEFFKDYACPQNNSRGIGPQEIETLLCDYRKMRKGTLLHGDKVLKLKDGIDYNKGIETAAKLYYGAKPLLDRRIELMGIGFSNITNQHCQRI
jgi:hypothetical protein